MRLNLGDCVDSACYVACDGTDRRVSTRSSTLVEAFPTPATTQEASSGDTCASARNSRGCPILPFHEDRPVSVVLIDRNGPTIALLGDLPLRIDLQRGLRQAKSLVAVAPAAVTATVSTSRRVACMGAPSCEWIRASMQQTKQARNNGRSPS
jgi:hypothetical protein